jgi:hypothetical protein
MTDYSTEISHAGLAAPIDAVEEAEKVAQDSANAGVQRYWANAEFMESLCLKLIDMTEANTTAVFELARQLVKARGPGEIMELCTEHLNKLFALFNTQAKELAAQAQEISDRSTAPSAHSVH